MRRIPKLLPPDVLVANADAWTDAILGESPSEADRLRYRHPDIKQRLLEETSWKCSYCESKIGHNCPGDIEHKIPKAPHPETTFAWENLTIACSECNRRKGQYNNPRSRLLDPNVDDVEARLVHAGPLVFAVTGDSSSEVTVRLLELSKPSKRQELIARKAEKLEAVQNLLERIAGTPPAPLKELLIDEVRSMMEASAEYSAMVMAYLSSPTAGFS